MEESFKNHRDFFSVIFVRHPDLEHQPNEGVEGLRGEGRLQDLSLYVTSPSSSVRLQVGQIILLLSSVPILFCQSLWNVGGFCLAT